MKTLKDAKVGETLTVMKLQGTGAIKRRIMDMGITKGTQVHIRKVAPLGLSLIHLLGGQQQPYADDKAPQVPKPQAVPDQTDEAGHDEKERPPA